MEEAIDLVGEAADGREGVERAVALRPDVVMLDIQMPVMNGIEAARQIKQRLPETKIVFFVAEVIWRTQAQAAGADAFLLKDTPIATVVDTILRVAGRTVPAEPERLPAPEAGIPPPPAPAPTPVRAPAPAAPVPPGLPVRPLPGRGVRRPRRPTSVPPAAARQPQAPGAPPPPVIPPPRQSLEVLAEAMSGSFPTPASGVMGAEGRRDLVALVRRIRTAADRLDQIGDELEAAVGPAGPGAVFAGPLPAPADEIAARTRREVVRALMDLAQSLAVIGQEPVAALLQTLQGRFASPTAEPPQASPAGGLALPLIQPPQPPTDWGYEPLPPPGPAAAPPLSAPATGGSAEASLPARAPEAAAIAGPVATTVQLSAYPSAAFSVMTKFMEALSQIAEVREVRAHRFPQGRLDATVTYAGPVPLEERLQELSEFRPTILRQGDDVIQFVLGI